MKFWESLLTQFIDLILPKETCVKDLENMTHKNFIEMVPPSETPQMLDSTQIEAIFCYKNPLMRKAMWEIKFQNNRKILKMVAMATAELLLPIVTDMEIFDKSRKILLIPVPLSEKRREERGYNQTAELAKEIIRALRKHKVSNIDLDEDVFKRVVNSEPQTRVRSRQRRLRNIKNAYIVTKPEKILNRNVIILDDVTTTGATLQTAASVIKACKPSRLLCLAIAH